MWVVATVVGSVDQRRRPIIRLQISGARDDVVALLDTGFNGELLVAQQDVQRLGVNVRPLSSQAIMGDGSVVEVRRGDCSIMWLGSTRRTEVLVSSVFVRAKLADDPVVLIGTQLLSPNLLLIDFAAATVEIEAHE